MRGKDTTPLTVAQTTALFADALTDGAKDLVRQPTSGAVASRYRRNQWHIRMARMAKARPAEPRVVGLKYEQLIGGWSVQLCLGPYRLHVLVWRE